MKKKFFVTLKTEDNETIIITTKASNIEKAQQNIQKGYIFKSLVDISEKPPNKIKYDLQNSEYRWYTLSLPYRNKAKVFYNKY